MNIGDKYELFFNPKNPNNIILEFRGMVDDEVVIFKTPKGNYKMESIDWFEHFTESGHLKEVR